MPFTFHGDSQLTYVQYLDVQASTTLIADPGGTYDMAPAGNWNLPVPPADGRWAVSQGGDPSAAVPSDPPPPLMTASGAEDEEN